MIEYLLSYQAYLDNENKKLKIEAADSIKKSEIITGEYQKKVISLICCLIVQEEELRECKKECKRLKKSVNVYELLLKLPSNVKHLSENEGVAYVQIIGIYIY